MTNEILFLPGMMLDDDMWSGQIGALKKIGRCRVGALSGADSIEGLADQALAVMAQPSHVVAFSMGAIVAMAMWRRAPRGIRSLSLLGFSPHADAPERAPARRRMMERAQCEAAENMVLKEMAPRYFSPKADERQIPGWTQRIAGAATRLGSGVLRNQLQAQLNRPNSVPTLETISVPTLVMIGEDDQLVERSDFLLTKKRSPGARHGTISSSGHMLMFEQPDAVNTHLLDFLQSVNS
jgi:pimeloyl-ACP methyl ester carboxylesterase